MSRWLNINKVYPQRVIQLSINTVRHGVTSPMCAMPLLWCKLQVTLMMIVHEQLLEI